jgi:aminoglycoside phosphotransferase (APT) family kinase protein
VAAAGDPRQKLGEGREAEIFAWDGGRALRLLRDPAGRPRLEHEATAMAAARQTGVSVPRVHEIVVLDGRPGMIMERVEGTDLLTDLARRPWRFARRARQLGRLEAQLHAVVAPGGLPDLRALLRERIEWAPRLPARLRASALDVLAELPDGDHLCHGDFHPGNVIVGRSGLVIIDWTNVAHGDPIGDLARTMLLLRVAERPALSALARALDRFGRGQFRRAWLRAYRHHRPVDPQRFERWETVNAAARLAEGLHEEVPVLVELLEARLA